MEVYIYFGREIYFRYQVDDDPMGSKNVAEEIVIS
jgi:hypothetical protein